MKYFGLSNLFFITLFIRLLSASAGANEKIVWLTNFPEAVKQSKEEEKLILMNFSGSDWCKPCIKLTKEVFETEIFQKFAKRNFVLLRLDFPRNKKNKLPDKQVKHNEKMADKYNSEGAFPLVLILDSDKEVIAKTEYRTGGPEKYIEHLKFLMTEDLEQ